MRIVVNDIAASSGGAMTVLKQFYEYVKQNGGENEWIFLLGDRYLEETEHIGIRCFPDVKKSRIKKVLFDCIYGKKIIDTLNPDVILSLQNIITFGARASQAVYIHQSIPFQNVKKFSFFKKKEFSYAFIQHCIGFLIKLSAQKADRVFVQTDWMKKKVSELSHTESEKIRVIKPVLSVMTPQKTESFDKKLFFYPTNGCIYKNTDTLIKACDLLNEENFTDFSVMLTLPPGRLKHKNIECTGYLSQTEMTEKYSQSTLVFPSYIETVGLPLLEAQYYNCIILASDTDFSRENLKEYASGYFFSPFSAFEIKELMKKVLTGKITRQDSIHNFVDKRDSWGDLLQDLLSIKKGK